MTTKQTTLLQFGLALVFTACAATRAKPAETGAGYIGYNHGGGVSAG